MFFLTTSVLLAVEGGFVYQVNGINVLHEKIKYYFQKNNFAKFRRILEKNSTFCFFFVIDGKIMVGIVGGSA